MLKKIFFFFVLFFPLTLRAEILDGFLFKPAFTLEVQTPEIRSKQANNDFENEPFEVQLKKFNNVVLGLNFRIHRYFGLNFNWSQFALESSDLNDYEFNGKSELNIENINFSSLFYLPVYADSLDLFAEIGGSDIKYDFKFLDSNNNQNYFKDHETAYFYGFGLEYTPYESELAFRLSAQRYLTKLHPINGDLVTWRVGLIKYF